MSRAPGLVAGKFDLDLGLDADELVSCVACGLCLPHCPTFRVTGRDTESPRGRIALMHAVQVESAPVSDDIVRSMQTCVQCRGCETACPSGVPFGHLMEDTRSALAAAGRITPRWQRIGLGLLGRPRLLRAASSLLAVVQRLGLVPWRRLGLPRRLPLLPARLRASGDDVVLFTGCVMAAWQGQVHRAAQSVIEATGAGVTPSGDAAPCCGALHVHTGLREQARRLARRVMAGIPGDGPILVDSAGCGAALQDYGRLLGTSQARNFSTRVLDVHEWLADRLDSLPSGRLLQSRVAVVDPCHLRHVQKSHAAVRAVLDPYVAEVVSLDDDGLCCGAGGSYALLEPELANDIRQRKLAAIDRSGASQVVSANPGCTLHLAAAGVPISHPLELLAQSLAGAGGPANPRTPGNRFRRSDSHLMLTERLKDIIIRKGENISAQGDREVGPGGLLGTGPRSGVGGLGVVRNPTAGMSIWRP